MPLVQAAADKLGLSLVHVDAHTSDELEAAFETAVREGAGGMVVGSDAIFATQSVVLALVTLAARHRLPTIYVVDTAVRGEDLSVTARMRTNPADWWAIMPAAFSRAKSLLTSRCRC